MLFLLVVDYQAVTTPALSAWCLDIPALLSLGGHGNNTDPKPLVVLCFTSVSELLGNVSLENNALDCKAARYIADGMKCVPNLEVLRLVSKLLQYGDEVWKRICQQCDSAFESI